MPITLRVRLPHDRTQLGSAWLVTEAGSSLLGPMPCLGISDNTAATAHGNPTHDPARQYGNTPTGLSRLMRLPPKDPNGYGPNHVYLLIPVSGQILTAEAEPNLRSGILIHGGRKNPAYTWWKGLRPTYGCIRFADEDMEKLDKQYDSYPAGVQWLCEVTDMPA